MKLKKNNAILLGGVGKSKKVCLLRGEVDFLSKR